MENKKEREEIIDKLNGKEIPNFWQEVWDLWNIFTKENTQKLLWEIFAQDIRWKAHEKKIREMKNFLCQSWIKSNTVGRIYSLLYDWGTEINTKSTNKKSQQEYKPELADIFIWLTYESNNDSSYDNVPSTHTLWTYKV